MDLALLQNMRAQTSQLADKRRDTSKEAYQQGLDLLAKAHASQFTDRAALKQASAAFIKAIQYNRQFADAYVSLAYLLLLINNQPMAIRYLHEARRVQPDHSDALALLDYIQHPENYTKTVAPEIEAYDQGDFELQDLEAPVATVKRLQVVDQADEQVEAVEQKIRKHLRLLLGPQPQPVLDPNSLAQLEKRYQELQAVCQELDETLMDLEAEVDTSGLRASMGPLERALQRLKTLRQVSRQLMRLREEMDGLRAEVLQQVQAPSSESSQLESQLESYLDRCDRYADQLDEWDRQGFSIQQIEPLYARLVAAVEQFQEMLDEHQA